MSRSQRCRLGAVGRGMVLVLALLTLGGCATGPDSRALRLAGQRAMIDHDYAVARGLFQEAYQLEPEDPANLHDLGDCCMHYARQRFGQRNAPAALREVDRAVAYYQRAINAHPGWQPALLGKNRALELKGQFEEALRVAKWAADFVGPAARQQIFLARELEERGDLDAAQLRYRQAVAVEPDNAAAHEELGRFFLRNEKRDLAIGELLSAYQLDPRRPGLREALTELNVPLPASPAE